jgi:glycosyltransferase involved in cell wall biosynthesis
VSVCVITYNQAPYIRKCLESIVTQRTDFVFEVIVGDDCSDDGTREIVDEYAKLYPGLVRPLFRDANIGIGRNYYDVHSAAVGEYVAHCDGDDYWYPGKLQYQVDLLDKMPNISQCWTCANIVDDYGKEIGVFPSGLARLLYPEIISVEDIALSYSLVGQHSTQMYRRKYKPELEPNKKYLDYWVAFIIALYGDAFYSKDILGAYRVTSSPSVTRNSLRKKVAVDLLSDHLLDIIKSYPGYAVAAKSNLVTRRYLSLFARHDLTVIDNNIGNASGTPCSWLSIIRSAYAFILQKITL